MGPSLHNADPLSNSLNEQEHLKAKTEMDELISKLSSQLKELTLKLQMAEDLLRQGEVTEAEVRGCNHQLRTRSCKLLDDRGNINL